MIFEVDRSNTRETRSVAASDDDLAPGSIRLRVERFALTSNNISYAVAGDMLGYWDFFPTEAPWGRVPVMGLGSVVESNNPDIALGGRYFGFYPMAAEHVVEARATGTGFVDVGPHRAPHAAAYTGFVDVQHEPSFRDDRANEYLLLRGLFMTSFLIDDFLDDNGFFGATQTLVTSASSKTSIALAHCLAARGHRSIGITSAGNVAFVESLDLYGQVITYDDIETLDATTPSCVVDMAGNAGVTSRIHHHFADNLCHSSQVGATHWDADGVAGPMPGPAPQFFFAPSQMAKRSEDWGPGELDRRSGAALTEFLETAPTWMQVEESAGPDAVQTVFHLLVEGNASAATGYIVSMNADSFDG